MSQGIPRIEEFPSDNRYWRVDWFGAIERNPNVPSEPYVQLVISPLLRNEDIHSTAKHLASTHITDYEKQRVISIGVGQLPFVSIGSIWLNGNCQAVKAGVQKDFYNLPINDKTVRTVPGNHQVEDKNLIPYDGYRTGKGFMANLVAIERDEDPYGMLIPAMELIRFYYAVSMDMAHVVFSGDLKHQPHNVVNPEKCGFDEEDNRCILHLRQHLSDEDGWVIGRILSSDEAWRGATAPNDVMMRDSLNKTFVHPESAFPFSGFTNLRVRGKFVRAIDSLSISGWRYLILGIDNCSAPFPFEKLTVGRDNDASQSEGEDELSDEDKKPAFAPPKHKTGDGEKPFQSANEPDQGKTNEHIPLPTDRFGAIMGKEVDRPEKDQCRYVSGLRHGPKKEEPKKLGTGLGNSDGSEAGRGHANQTQTRRKALPASFENFKEAVGLLNRVEGIQARIRLLDEAIEYIPLTKPANQRQWSYLDSSTRCRRQVIIVDICYQKRWYSLIEFEMRKNESCTVALVSQKTGECWSNLQLNGMLNLLAQKKGVWFKIKQGDFPENELIPLRHTWTNTVDFIKKVMSKLSIFNNKTKDMSWQETK